MTFKVGDKVKCIEANFSGDDLYVNEIYTITSSDGYCCQLEHTGKHQWNMSRFELVQPQHEEGLPQPEGFGIREIIPQSVEAPADKKEELMDKEV